MIRNWYTVEDDAVLNSSVVRPCVKASVRGAETGVRIFVVSPSEMIQIPVRSA